MQSIRNYISNLGTIGEDNQLNQRTIVCKYRPLQQQEF